MAVLNSGLVVGDRTSHVGGTVVAVLTHSRTAVPWTAALVLMAALILAAGSLFALSPVAWVALIAVAPLTVALVRQIQAACSDRSAASHSAE
ncbi:hypothetical protein [Rhodococcoides yunnanense]|uniref:hypothetical protein n=1 Tax=Rhodococcoides yunnanense TaxID=278209 RepID=UPI001114D4C2|nr:hypothetical protein [Rhodococcus yunnanensis]